MTKRTLGPGMTTSTSDTRANAVSRSKDAIPAG
jgi:hypothetical protein